MKSTRAKSTEPQHLSLFSALEGGSPVPGREIPPEALKILARSSKTVAMTGDGGWSAHPDAMRLPYIDVAMLPKDFTARLLGMTTSGDEHHEHIAVGVYLPDGRKAHRWIYVTRKALREALAAS